MISYFSANRNVSDENFTGTLSSTPTTSFVLISAYGVFEANETYKKTKCIIETLYQINSVDLPEVERNQQELKRQH